jgi:hypothetical protein
LTALRIIEPGFIMLISVPRLSGIVAFEDIFSRQPLEPTPPDPAFPP